jgi:hypothetical protein
MECLARVAMGWQPRPALDTVVDSGRCIVALSAAP